MKYLLFGNNNLVEKFFKLRLLITVNLVLEYDLLIFLIKL